MRASAVLAASTLVLTATLTACGGNDKPAVCGSVDDLKSSISGLTDLNLKSGSALTDLQGQLTTIKSDFDTVKADATSQFSAQIKAVDTSYTALQTTAGAAVANTTVATLAAAATDLSTFASAVQTLITDVQETC
jgi:hypothetical protein